MCPDKYILELESRLARLEQENKSLREGEEKFAKAFHENQVPMSITRIIDGVLIDANKKYAETMGYRREDIIGKSNYSELNICRQSFGERNLKLEQLRDIGCVENLELEFRRRNGEIGTAISTHTLINLNGELCRLMSAIDITERKKMEEALVKSDEKFTTIFYKNNCAMAITRFEDGIIFDINDCASDIIGHKREDLLGKNIKELGIWGESFKREILIEQLRNGSGMEFETKYIMNTGDMGTVLAKVDIMELDGIKYALISGVDITERKKTEEALRASEDKFSKSFHDIGTMNAIARFNDGVLIDVNESYASTFGFDRQEMIGKSALELGIWEDPSGRQEMLKQLSEEGFIRDHEYIFRTKSGEIGSMVSSVNLINIQGEEYILVSSNNITKLKQYEREISRLDNFNLMGQMAGSIAHEIRNPMTSIKGFLQLFHEQDKYEEDREAFELMIEELNRVNDIITAFLSMSKQNLIEMKLLNLNDCIAVMLQLIVADALVNEVFIGTKLEHIPPIMADNGEFKQLLLNLTRNAIQAMPLGGNLTIKTFENENGVNLVVQDEGQGIPPEILDKIGTPFLTTKENGTGLGLAVCFSIAERHNAKITVDSSPEGTNFTVTFPVVA